MAHVPHYRASYPSALSRSLAQPLLLHRWGSTSGKGRKRPSLEEVYQKKTPIEHILLRPDSYVGSIQKATQEMWVYDTSSALLAHREVAFVPGLYKIVDEILVNAADNKRRDTSMDEIRITIDRDKNEISVFNTGRAVPVEFHKTENVYLPEMLFGQLLTGSNFNDDVMKLTGGRNGYGAKLANIFSCNFGCEIADANSQLYYQQNWESNMRSVSKPTITPLAEVNLPYKSFTRVYFSPDLARFPPNALDADFVSLVMKRAVDLAATLDNVNVYLNDQLVDIADFKTYVHLLSMTPHLTAESTLKLSPNCGTVDGEAGSNGEGGDGKYMSVGRELVEQRDKFPELAELSDPLVIRLNDRWEVGVAASEHGIFQQVSFVNSICTLKGGTHVNYITDIIAKHISQYCMKKLKIDLAKPHVVRQHLFVSVNSLIENPAFDSQTKEHLTSAPSDWGSLPVLPASFLKDILEKSGIVSRIEEYAAFKNSADLRRKGNTNNTQRLLGLPKLEDAHLAGTNRSNECTLILTEGDSAKALAVAGLAVVGRDKWGVFPLRGKMLNVRDASHKQILNNTEITNLIRILGLQHGVEYGTIETRDLRYGKVLLMMDQDHDGSHIKGLFMNLLHVFWPSLLEHNDFLEEFITPLVKVSVGNEKKKQKETKTFYTLQDYVEWQSNNEGVVAHASVKYYKGLGTNTAAEGREYFSDMEKHRVVFEQEGVKDSHLIERAFSRSASEWRKGWLLGYDRQKILDHSVGVVSIQDFINAELIHFSHASNVRAIPSVCDGLKPGQRKVLFSCFKRNLREDVKVAQLAGYVSENTAYHHGEASLHATIIAMAQSFVGSNNLSLLVPSGQFGTRLEGGKDAASPRYVFTRLSPLARKIFPPGDDPVLEYLSDDGQSIEPMYYVPIIPLLLVNGAVGVGTGWSTTIPAYSPLDIIECIRRKLAQSSGSEALTPWWRGFQGTVISNEDRSSYVTQGVLKVDPANYSVRILELPIGSWTDRYKEFLESLCTKNNSTGLTLKSYRELHTEERVDFELLFTRTNFAALQSRKDLHKLLKLESSVPTSNMHAFNSSGVIAKYSSPEAILDDFYQVRYDLYVKRRAHQLCVLGEDLQRLKHRMKFLNFVTSGKLALHKMKESQLNESLASLGIPQQNNSYSFLLNTPLSSLTADRLEALKKEAAGKERDLQELQGKPVEAIWLEELDALEAAIRKHYRL